MAFNLLARAVEVRAGAEPARRHRVQRAALLVWPAASSLSADRGGLSGVHVPQPSEAAECS
jgi:hypothetical protein